MKHYGDITKLSGWTLPIVDCIIGGSPCQDLSLAGKRAGLDGARSGLFMEQIRITKEMRERDRLENGRSGFLCRPRFMGWENVPGTFSSNGGRDFQAVLTEIVRIAEPDAPDVPLPDDGRWPKSGCIYEKMGGWSVAWRVHDAQHWGVPQRRKRIAVVADFGGLSAPEVQFERKGMCRYPQPGEEAREEAPRDSGSGAAGTDQFGGALSFQERAGKPGGGKGILIQNEHVGALSTLNNQSVLAYPEVANALTQRYDGSPQPDKGNGANIVVAFKQGAGAKAGGIGLQEECAPTLGAAESGTQMTPAICYSIPAFFSEAMLSDNPNAGFHEAETARTLDNNGGSPACQQGGTAAVSPRVWDARGNGDGDTAPTITGDHEDRVTDYTAIVHTYSNQAIGMYVENEKAPSIKQRDYKDSTDLVVAAVDCRNATENADVNGTRQAKEQGQNLNSNNVVRTGRVVRRLTPLECERLQGFPDGWTDIGDWVDSKGKKHKGDSDSPRYKALGNSIAVGYANKRSGFWMRMVKRISAQYDRAATLGSLFDGIGGFPLAWEAINGKGTAVWASEVEEFCIAVTKKHFPEETGDG